MINQDQHDTREFKSRLNILVVDDNPRIQQVIGWMLETAECRPVMAANGLEALAKLAQDHFDLVLMDLQMPELNGFETTARIRGRELATGEHIPILAITGFHLENGRQKCLDSGMDDYLEKPFGLADLLEIIERLTKVKLPRK